MGTGDWNDGMNLVGPQGRGESVWVAWFLMRTIGLFAPLVESRDPERAQRWRSRAETMRHALEASAWDGNWYRRATFDDGTWLGSRSNAECRIDSIAQSWAVLSRVADPRRATTAMRSVAHHLIREQDGLALLFTPPFDQTLLEPGYIKGYPVGLRENGGQYSHAAMWTVLALAQLRAREQAHGLFALLNPINHSRTPEQMQRYKVEPYVVAADIYSVAPHIGRGGWTWYTGSAAWMYRAGVEGILGIRRQGRRLLVDPCIPAEWPGFTATVTIAQATCTIEVRAARDSGFGEAHRELDGMPMPPSSGPVSVPIDGRSHRLLMFV
jgi:cyclic beta-1,2-glucan synthetase